MAVHVTQSRPVRRPCLYTRRTEQLHRLLGLRLFEYVAVKFGFYKEFLYISTLFLRATAYMLQRGYATPIPSVCLSVRPSVTRVYCIKTAERIIEILSLSDRPI